MGVTAGTVSLEISVCSSSVELEDALTVKCTNTDSP